MFQGLIDMIAQLEDTSWHAVITSPNAARAEKAQANGQEVGKP